MSCMFLGSHRLVLSALLLFCGWALGCDTLKDQASEAKQTADRAGVWDGAFQLNQDTKGVLYTWVDESGLFQITDEPGSIPTDNRKVVRVVVEGQSPGGPEHVFVADLSNIDGNFPVAKMPRSQWEALGQAGRQKKIAELRPAQEEQAPSPSDLGVDAIIYGADWCKPCHLAEDYLKKKGARVVKKDVEEDAGAAAEMQAKLKTAGMRGSSIPVLDVGGVILRGFSAPSIDAALRTAKK